MLTPCTLKKIICSLTICTLCATPSLASPYSANIHFIDVGYGDAILIELPDDKTILIDAGDQYNANYLVEYLSALKIKDLDAVILTHPHKNHFGGFFSLIKKWPIKRFYINGDIRHAEEGYEDLVDLFRRKKIPIVILKEGDELSLEHEEIHLTVLHPLTLERSTNENTLVILLTVKDTSFLFTSDIYERQQDELLEQYPEIKTANVVQVPHHGGKITERFAGSFGSHTFFIVSTGENKHGKPLTEEMDKLKGKVFRTDVYGTILLKSDGSSVEVYYERYQR